MSGDTINEPSLEKEERAYEMLQWGYPVPLAAYDEIAALNGFYSRVQKQRSDAALNEWEEKHPYETSPELAAFKELESIGVLTQTDFYSPDKAERCPRWIDPKDKSKGLKTTCTSYKDDLRKHKQQQSIQEGVGATGFIRASGSSRLPGNRLAFSNEKPISSSSGKSGRDVRTTGRLSQSGETDT